LNVYQLERVGRARGEAVVGRRSPQALAALHALAFTDCPRPWTAAEFALLLAEPSTLLTARPAGFALGRVAGPEAELMTLAVHPGNRRRGHGTALVLAFEAAAAARGAEEAFLEVAASNVPARGLYARLGYACAGRRPAYYTPAGAPPVDALVLRKRLGKTI
jgi:ribosomal-protein-alanine N-acetyltransferase